MADDPRQDRDGTPHLSYYDTKSSYSFTWDGRAVSLVQAAHGGYGEPVTATFPFDRGRAGSVIELLNRFELCCQEWLVKTFRPEPDEPQGDDWIIDEGAHGRLQVTPMGRTFYNWKELWDAANEEMLALGVYPNFWIHREHGLYELVRPGYGTGEAS